MRIYRVIWCDLRVKCYGCPYSFSNAGLFYSSGFCRGRGSGLGLEWLPADCATHCLPQALCICTSVTRCEYILVSSAPTSMLATVTDAHMPGHLVQSAGKMLWLSSLFLWRRSLMRICRVIWRNLRVKCFGCPHSLLFAYSEKGKGPCIEHGPFPFQRFLSRAGEWFGFGMASG